MIKPKITISNVQGAKDAIRKALDDFMTNKSVTVGVHEDDSGRDSGDITNASLGAVHEFGADIDHPGGTSYGFASKAAADRNEVRFLKTGKGYAELGTTVPHTVSIPARPWLNPGVNSGNLEYLKIIEKAAANGQPLDLTLNKIGVTAVGLVQKYMIDLRSPPNAASTIKKKGSSNPLIGETSSLLQSITYKITTSKPTEGL